MAGRPELIQEAFPKIAPGADITLIALPDQVDRLEMQDLSAALAKLDPEQREALILVGVEGLSYEDGARVMGVATGTMKSRVNRARTRLAQLLGMDPDDAGGSRIRGG